MTSVLSFADDTGVVGKNYQSAQRLINIAASGFARYGLKLNASKTHWLAIIGGRTLYQPDDTPSTIQEDDNKEEVIDTSEVNTKAVYRRNAQVTELRSLILDGQDIQPIDHHAVARY